MPAIFFWKNFDWNTYIGLSNRISGGDYVNVSTILGTKECEEGRKNFKMKE